MVHVGENAVVFNDGTCEQLSRFNKNPTTSKIAHETVLQSRLRHWAISVWVDRVSATETVNSGSISGRDKPKTVKIGFHSFFACRSALKETEWSLHRVW